MARYYWWDEQVADIAETAQPIWQRVDADVAESSLDPTFLYACERNLDPPVRCPSCKGRIDWGLHELRALDEGVGVWCPLCSFDFDADRERRPLHYAME